jgi:hypothetical protein
MINDCLAAWRKLAVLRSGRISNERIQPACAANLVLVLNDVCEEFPNGGDHETRRFVAEQLVYSARSGRTSIEHLLKVGKRAVILLQSARHVAERKNGWLGREDSISIGSNSDVLACPREAATPLPAEAYK